MLERLDGETRQATAFFEIERAEQYASRGVRRMVISGDVLYAATDFGVVVFDLVRRRPSARPTPGSGTLAAGTPVNDVVAAPLPDGAPGLWVATDDGVR